MQIFINVLASLVFHRCYCNMVSHETLTTRGEKLFAMKDYIYRAKKGDVWSVYLIIRSVFCWYVLLNICGALWQIKMFF